MHLCPGYMHNIFNVKSPSFSVLIGSTFFSSGFFSTALGSSLKIDDDVRMLYEKLYYHQNELYLQGVLYSLNPFKKCQLFLKTTEQNNFAEIKIDLINFLHIWPLMFFFSQKKKRESSRESSRERALEREL